MGSTAILKDEHMLDSINFLILLSGIASLWLGIVIYRSDPTARANRLYSVNVLFVLLWIAAMVFYRSAGSGARNIATTLLYLVPILIPSTLLHFTYLFPVSVQLQRWKLYLIYILSGLLAVLLLIPGAIFIDTVIPAAGERIILWGPLYFLYAAYFMGVFSYAFWRLSHNYFRGAKPVQRQALAMLVGYNIGANVALVTNVILPWFGNFQFNWVGQLMALFMVAGVAYAMTMHHMFNVKLVATEAFAVATAFTLLFNIFIPSPVIFTIAKVIIFFAVSYTGYLLVRSVLTEIRQKEELTKLSHALEDANEQLKRLDETKSEFVSIASHQLRTPLTVIKGYISMILEGSFGSVPEKYQSPLEKVYESGERLIELVENLLSVSRIESGRMKYNTAPTQLTDLAASVVDELTGAAKKKSLALKFIQSAVSPPVLNLDAEKIRQVMMNLVDNAIKYSKRGSVVVSVHAEDQRTNRRLMKPSVVFSVQDTGNGVRPEDQPRLFQKFIRGQGSALVHTEGTGLGLYVGRMMVEAHNGVIWVESKGEGFGSTFAFAIPIPDPPKSESVRALEQMLG